MNIQPFFRPGIAQQSPISLDRPSLDKFLSYCTKRHYPSKSDIFKPGDPANTLYYVISGSVSIVSEEKDGHELVLSYINLGEFVGELGLFSPTEYRHVHLRARGQAEIAEIRYDKLMALFVQELAPECPKILYAIGSQMSKRLLSASRKASSLAFVDVTERIMRTVLELCYQPEAMTHPQGMQIKASRQELARLSGCSREMAGRALKDLEGQGRLTAKGKTIVVFGTR